MKTFLRKNSSGDRGEDGLKALKALKAPKIVTGDGCSVNLVSSDKSIDAPMNKSYS